MKPEHAALLSNLLENRPVASLGTLHEGKPLVSMVPFAVFRAEGGAGFVIHVSGLSAHTRDMQRDSNVSLMIVENEDEAETPLAMARVTLECVAVEVPHDAPEGQALARVYLSKFPDAQPLLSFPDFRFFLLVPRSARFVAGFGQAMTLGEATIVSMLLSDE
jgi:putative heme iron utilization protein